jgi:hypothetical protein
MQVSLDARVLIQQVRKPALPRLGLGGTGLLKVPTLYCGELVVGLRQPPIRRFGSLGMAVSEQPGDLVPCRFPRVGSSGSNDRVSGQRRQCRQGPQLLSPTQPPVT